MAFPEAFVAATDAALVANIPLDPEPSYVNRPIRFTDPALTFAVYPDSWAPNEGEGFEMRSVAPEPVAARYLLGVQVLVKGTEEEGREMLADYTKIVRAILYRDSDYQVALAALSETMLGYIERYQKRGITNQRFQTNELRGTFFYVSTTSLWFEVEQTPL